MKTEEEIRKQFKKRLFINEEQFKGKPLGEIYFKGFFDALNWVLK